MDSHTPSLPPWPAVLSNIIFVISFPQASAQHLHAQQLLQCPGPGRAEGPALLAGSQTEPRTPASSPNQQMLEFTTNLTTEGSWRCQPCCPDHFCPPSTSGVSAMNPPGSSACLDGLFRSENSGKKQEGFISAQTMNCSFNMGV